MRTGISKLFEVTRDKDQSSLVTVLVGLQTKGVLTSQQLLTGIRKSTDQLEDLRLVIERIDAVFTGTVFRHLNRGTHATCFFPGRAKRVTFQQRSTWLSVSCKALLLYESISFTYLRHALPHRLAQ